jgi:hypothetical protein
MRQVIRCCSRVVAERERIAFVSNRKGVFNLYVQPSNGAGTEELLLETPNNKSAEIVAIPQVGGLHHLYARHAA